MLISLVRLGDQSPHDSFAEDFEDNMNNEAKEGSEEEDDDVGYDDDDYGDDDHVDFETADDNWQKGQLQRSVK